MSHTPLVRAAELEMWTWSAELAVVLVSNASTPLRTLSSQLAISSGAAREVGMFVQID